MEEHEDEKEELLTDLEDKHKKMVKKLQDEMQGTHDDEIA